MDANHTKNPEPSIRPAPPEFGESNYVLDIGLFF